mgnify:CR=1 FL=1|tara:strand:- start:13140 stop:13352 length:213 start_codon:yes stop_codon:yes gene_type:complete
MLLSEVNWDYVDKVSDVDQADSSIVVHYIDGGHIKVLVPMSLMKAMIARGEQNYIDQDIERSEWDPNRPD